MTEKVTILSSGSYIPVLVFYTILGVITRNLVADIGRHVIFIGIIFLFLYLNLKEHIKDLNEKRTLSYYFLYFGVFFLLFQNTLLVIMHGFNILQYSLFEGTIEFDPIDSVFSLYRTAFTLDILGYCLLGCYLYFLKTSYSKEKYRFWGLIGLALFTGITLLWRLISSFYVSEDLSTWLSSELTVITKLLIFASQFGLCTFWFCFWNLYKINPQTSTQPFLDNQINRNSEIANRARIVTILLFITTFLAIFFLDYDIESPISDILRLFFLLKTLIVPFTFVYQFMAIYSRYNLLF